MCLMLAGSFTFGRSRVRNKSLAIASADYTGPFSLENLSRESSRLKETQPYRGERIRLNSREGNRSSSSFGTGFCLGNRITPCGKAPANLSPKTSLAGRCKWKLMPTLGIHGPAALLHRGYDDRTLYRFKLLLALIYRRQPGYRRL